MTTRAQMDSHWHSWLDYSRICATLVIVLFHMPSSPLARATIPPPAETLLSFFGSAGGALAFFFITAGYLSKRILSWSKWGNKLLLLLFPYVTWNVLCIPGLNDEITLGRIMGLGSAHAFCADYPLWFVRDLFLLLLFYPIYHRIALLPAFVCAFLWITGGNQWPWGWANDLPLPRPSNTLLFLSGLIAAQLPLDRWKVFFLRTAPLWWIISVLTQCSLIPKTSFSPLLGALCLYSTGACAATLLPATWAGATRLASKASFLCYAAHAPAILVIAQLAAACHPPLCSYSWIYYVLPAGIYAASIAGYKGIETFLPSLLPFLAHAGTLPWRREPTATR